MISFDEAVEFVRSIAKPLETETIAIANAAGRILARPVVAQIDSPRSDVSAMDGYAVREEDLKSFPALLQLVVFGIAILGDDVERPVLPRWLAYFNFMRNRQVV